SGLLRAHQKVCASFRSDFMHAKAPTISDSAGITLDGVALAARARRDAAADRFFKSMFAGAGWLVLIVLVAAAASMLWGGKEALTTFGWSFLTSTEWDAVQHKFGALVPIYGTL